MIPYSELTTPPPTPPNRRESYGDEPLQFGELRLPVAGEKYPLVVLLHGGCWLAEYSLAHAGHAAAALADAGFAVWMPEYRRLGDAGGGWPGTFEDVARAVDHARSLAAATPGIDATRIILAGHSAGGHLALWAGSRRAGEPSSPGTSSVNPIPIAGVVGLAAITDLAAYGASPGDCNASVYRLLGGSPAEVGPRYKAVSPFERIPPAVPVFLVHGSDDAIVPLAMAERYADTARKAGGRVTVSVVPGAGHFDIMAPWAPAWTYVIDAFRAAAK